MAIRGVSTQAEDAALRLWKEGWVVFCPHKNAAHFGGALGIPDGTWLEGDMEILRRCDAIYMLNNWKDSKGAILELQEASRLGLMILYEAEGVG